MKTSSLYDAIRVAFLVSVVGTPGSAAAWQTIEEHSTVGAAEVSPEAEPSQVQAATELEQVTVTGTRIRGGTSPSPVLTIGAEHIREEGFTDLGEVIRSVPQNFGGGQNPGVAGGATTGAGGLANQNLTGGSSLNLRGLGPDASLTLLNGRRMSYGGFVQAVDIGAIPVEAVDRVEILPDGASALYGSDAVGGVANVLLRREYHGVGVGVRHGGATDGGLDTREYTATAGRAWASGGFIVALRDASTDPLYARQRDYTRHMAHPSTLFPGSDVRSALLSGHQALGAAVTLRLDALRTERDQLQHPYNRPQLPYSNVMVQDSTATFLAPGADVALGDWTLQLGAGLGRDRLVNQQSRVALADGAVTRLSHDCYCNEVVSYDVGIEGPMFALAGGEARLALGVGQRTNEFAQHNRLVGSTPIAGSERTRHAYAELGLPLVGADNARPWVRRLALNLAARTERYDSFGSVTTPKLGLVYGPGEDVTLKASWGRSFKAPTLFQRYWAQQALLRPAAFFGDPGIDPEDAVLMLGGGNPDLGAERARTWSASLALHPRALPGLEAELTWFDIDYAERVVQPITNPDRALGNPAYARFIHYAPSVEEQAAVIEGADIFYNLMGTPYDPDRVVAILYSQYFNVARQRIRGVDLSASYRMELGEGRLTLRGAGSWLDSSQQSTPGEASYDLAGTLFSPAKVNARAGAVWARGGFGASAFVNYTAGVEGLPNAGEGGRTASFTTFDATLRYETPDAAGLASGMEFALSAQNLFNRAPPFYTPPYPDFPPYDSTNYSAVGRVVSLSIAKRF
ncbi:TonB-dependent receptor [Luteimonas viscosa]|uniref:TonB-dependent receptor n=1 Tax=Luteimonas viscosa TaxID=1132694 RepID=A0A5D4XPX2_9GAMM|nr:TonB-dependent receptor [Luteimonas viscosa]TYT26174.1 TonB-dependent receptor [Luteimonas viscosa]